MMRQAGRHMAAYRALVEKYPTFRDRSETPEAALEISLQPWKSYGVDGVILFSDILTPLPAMGVDFDISEGGAIKIQPIRTREALAGLKKIEVKTAAPFVGEVLGKLREAVGNTATVLGFIGLPFTLASYCVEGKTGTTTGFAEIAAMRENDPALLHDLLALLADNIADYACYQIESGAQVMQIFDSWAGHLPEPAYREFALKYQQRVVKTIKARHPTTPIIIYAAPDVHSRDGKLLHLLVEAGADVVSIDHTVALDSSIVASTIPAALGIQGNLDPKVLRDGPLSLIKEQTEAILKAGMDRGFHMMNLGHGIEATTPEPHAKFFVDTVQNYKYAEKKA
ncbi:Uroporphyrinogen decarboxylase [Pelagophyceae sp. CCMP2097]|nr:Uroporphyrinogen decarboxylase [Pelagophyceae sp. CCMP2097]